MVQSSTEVAQEISFFSKREDCIANFERSSWAQRIVYFFKSCLGSIEEHFLKIALLFGKERARMAGYTGVPDGGFHKRKLVVCLHGLNNSPTHFKEIIDDMKNSSEMDIYVPCIRKQGNSKLDKMILPILEVITQWAQGEDDKELVIVGISNGERIARALEAKIGDLKAIKKLKIVSIVGAWNGSSLVDLANRTHLSWLFVNKNIRTEMSTDSASVLKLNKEWLSSFQQSTFTREYTFIASPHDWHIPNFDSTLPEIPNKEGVNVRYAIVPGTGHNGMEKRVSKGVAAIIES